MGPRKRQRPRKQVVASSESAKKVAAKPPASKPAKSVAAKPAAAGHTGTAPPEPTASTPAETAPTKPAAHIQPQKQSRRIRGLKPDTTPIGQQGAAQQGEAAVQERADSPPAIAAPSAPDPESKPNATSKPRPKEDPPSNPIRDSASGTKSAEDAEGAAENAESEPEDAEDAEDGEADTGNPGEEELQSEAGEAQVSPVAAQPVFIGPTEHWVMANTTDQQIAALKGLLGTLEAGKALQSALPISPQDRVRRGLQSSSRQSSKRCPASKTDNGSSTVREAGSNNGSYRAPNFRATLERGAQGVKLYMPKDSDEDGPEETSRVLLKKLEEESYDPSADERYKAEVLRVKLDKLVNKNERNVVHTLHDLFCPAAEDLAALNHGDARLHGVYKNLIDQWDEPWTKAPRLLGRLPVPRPDYCVGFIRKAFTAEQWSLLDRLPSITPAATDYLHFPFLTCEAKSPKDQIYYAENQNAHSMMVTVSSTVKLFRAAKMEGSAHRRVLAFSVSYNSTHVALYGYYPVVAGTRTEIYRREVHSFPISPGAPNTWQPWHFVRNIYEVWAPQHLEHLQMAVNALRMNASLERRRASATPTPSESASMGLQQLGLQSPAPPSAQPDNVSERSNPGRVRRSTTESPAGDPKRVKVN